MTTTILKEIDPLELDHIMLNAMSWAREAGGIQLQFFRHKGLKVETKLNESDIVTAADRASEHCLLTHIHSTYPTHSILSEESGEENRGHDGWQWVIDPLDGTTNFNAGLPNFSVSIGIKYSGTTVGGVVFAPYLNEMFHAIRGQGAWLNGEAIAPKPTTLIERAVVATGFPVDKNVNPDNNLDNVARVLPLIRGLRRLGSAAIDISYVAAGFLDAYWEMNLHEWDVAAALLILEEAGGRHRFYRSDRCISVLTSCPGLFDQLSPLIR
ncbi:MAG: inositol monophosphatase [Bacteroidales bacterium]|nr:inositol monophosphatase [Bacteroidales bacterium]